MMFKFQKQTHFIFEIYSNYFPYVPNNDKVFNN